MYYFGARYYDASIGRFITKDPFKGYERFPASLHPYIYCYNNPVNLIDPDGMDASLLSKIIEAIKKELTKLLGEERANEIGEGIREGVETVSEKTGLPTSFVVGALALSQGDTSAIGPLDLVAVGAVVVGAVVVKSTPYVKDMVSEFRRNMPRLPSDKFERDKINRAVEKSRKDFKPKQAPPEKNPPPPIDPSQSKTRRGIIIESAVKLLHQFQEFIRGF